jgi:hypothetical protein
LRFLQPLERRARKFLEREHAVVVRIELVENAPRLATFGASDDPG